MHPVVLTGPQFRSLVKSLNLSGTDLALLTGAAPSTISEWGRRASVPHPVSMLLLLFHAQPNLVQTARALVLRTAPYMLPAQVLKMDSLIDEAEAMSQPRQEFKHKTLEETIAEIEAQKASQGPGERTLPPGKTGPFD